MNRFLTSLIIGALLLLLHGSRSTAEPIAVFDGGSVTTANLDLAAREIPRQYQQRWLEARPDEFRETLYHQVLDSRLLYAGWKKGLVDAPGIAPIALDEIRIQTSLALMEEYLLDIPSRPSREEVETYYEQHPEEFLGFEQISLRHVFIQVSDDFKLTTEESAKETIQQAYRELIDGASITEVARRYGHLSQGNYERGAVVRAETHLMNPVMQEAVRQLEPGQLSEPFRTPHGWEIVYLEDRKPQAPLPLSQVSAKIVRQLYEPERSARLEYLRKVAHLEDGPAKSSEENGFGREWLSWAGESGFRALPSIQEKIQQVVEGHAARTYLQEKTEAMRVGLAPDEAELRRHFESNRETYRIPEMKSGWILSLSSGVDVFTTPVGEIAFLREAMLEKKAQAEEALAAGADFVQVAVDFTESATAAGDIYLPPAPSHGVIFDTLVEDLEEGEVSEWRIGPDVVSMAKLEKRLPSRLPDFEEVRQEVEAHWFQSRIAAFQQELLVSLANQLNLRFQQESLATWLPSEEAMPSDVSDFVRSVYEDY